MKSLLLPALFLLLVGGAATPLPAQTAPSEQQLARWLQLFPEADADKDGKLTAAEALAYRKTKQKAPSRPVSAGGGTPQDFEVDPGWDAERFPEHAVSYQSPEEIRKIYAGMLKPGQPEVTSYDKPADGALRLVGTGHSFMAPGYGTLPAISRAAGFERQPLFTHTGGGITGSARYKWEQENGIFQFDGKPVPKLLSSIANAEWDAMMWGPYYHDRPAYYECWIDFCLQHNPGMKFYLSDAWPQLGQLDEIPTSEKTLTADLFTRLGKEKNAIYAPILEQFRQKYPGKVFIMPTCDAMVLAVEHFHRGELPGIEGIHQFVGGKERSLWRDQLGHLGPGFDRLEGYVFYATLYGRSPESIEGDITFGRGNSTAFPDRELDRTFRKIAWEAVIHHPFSGVTDADGDGLADPAAR